GLGREPAAATRTSSDMLRAQLAQNGATDAEIAILLSECVELTCCIPQDDQIVAHIENKSADTESAMTFKQGVSGNPHGNRHRTRHLLNQEFMQALLLNFRHEGKKAIEKVARNQPAVYVKILALLVPREMQVEHTNSIKQMTDEQLERGIELIEEMLAKQEA